MQTQDLTVFVARKDGRSFQIGLTKDEVLRSLPKNPFYTPGDSANWKISSELLRVPGVKGELVVADNGTPHICWDCPHCNELHACDLERDDTNPSLWFCEQSVADEQKICLVSW